MEQTRAVHSKNFGQMEQTIDLRTESHLRLHSGNGILLCEKMNGNKSTEMSPLTDILSRTWRWGSSSIGRRGPLFSADIHQKQTKKLEKV